MLRRLTFLFLLLMLCYNPTKAQVNLVPNPSFEDTNSCPTSTGGIDYSTGYFLFPTVKAWANPLNNGTPDYFNACSSTAGVPSNFFGYQPAHSGNAYAGIWALIDSFAYSGTTAVQFMENIECKLTNTLVAGKKYAISFYASLSPIKYYAGNIVVGINKLGAHLSDTFVYSSTGYSLSLSSDAINTSTYVTDTTGWTLVQGYYRAVGGEQWLTLGNFTNSIPLGKRTVVSGSHQTVSYVYIDDVSVQLADSVVIDSVICSNVFPVMLIGDTISGRYKWNTGDTTANISVSDTGYYWRRVFKDSLYYDDTFRIIKPQSVGLDTIMCTASFPISLNGTWSPAGVSYSWNTGAITASISASDTGTYWRKTTGFSCINYTDTIKILRRKDAGIDTNICSNIFPLTISGVGIGSSYSWNTGATTASISIRDTGTYMRTTSVPPCVHYTDTIKVIWPQSTGLDTIECTRTFPLTLTSRTISGARYTWNTGSNSSSISVSGAGTYWRRTYGIACVDFTDTFKVRQQKDTGVDTLICSTAFPITIHGDGTGKYLWNTGDTTATISANAAGIYWRRTSVPPCVLYTDTINVVAPKNTGVDTTICTAAFPVTINGTGSLVGATYQWNTGATSSTLNVSSPGKYWRRTTASSCINYTDTIYVYLLKTKGSTYTICNPAFPALIQGSTTTGRYLWNTGDTTSSIHVNDTGTYWRKTVDLPCVNYVDTIKVKVTAKPFIGNDTTYCFGETATIKADKVYPQYLWNTGATTSSINVTDPGEYVLTITDDCGSKSDTININFYPKTPLPIVRDTVVCQDRPSPTLTVDGANLKWYENNSGTGTPTQPVINTSAVGNQVIYVSQTLHNCESDKATLNIGVISIPEINLGADTTICKEDRIQIGHPDSTYTYKWSTGETVCCIVPQEKGTYILQATNICGVTTDSIAVDVADCQHCLWVPTAFTPNGDGKNDILRAKPLCPIQDFTMKIYDRWGELIFISHDINYGWDGISMGVPVDVGTYYYFIDFQPGISILKRQVVKGSVVLIR